MRGASPLAHRPRRSRRVVHPAHRWPCLPHGSPSRGSLPRALGWSVSASCSPRPPRPCLHPASPHGASHERGSHAGGTASGEPGARPGATGEAVRRWAAPARPFRRPGSAFPVEAGPPVAGLDLVGLEGEALTRQDAFERAGSNGVTSTRSSSPIGDLGHDRVEGLVAGVDHGRTSSTLTSLAMVTVRTSGPARRRPTRSRGARASELVAERGRRWPLMSVRVGAHESVDQAVDARMALGGGISRTSSVIGSDVSVR